MNVGKNTINSITFAHCRWNSKRTEVYGITPEGKKVHLKNIRIHSMETKGLVRRGSIAPDNIIIQYEKAIK